MEDGEKGLIGSDEQVGKAVWTTPLLVGCGSMLNVLADEGFAGDGTATGSDFSS
jgi:hypothetical protein